MKNYTNTSFITVAKAVVLCGTLAVSAAASAQTAGSWLIKLGYNRITPQVSSGNMSAPSLPGTKMDVESASAAILTGAYMFTDNISAELYLGTPYKHDVVGDGAIGGVGKMGTVEQLPPTLFAQYRFFEAKSAFRPYVGLGLTYAMFQKETGSAVLTALTRPGTGATIGGTTFKVDSAWGITPQIGVTYAFNDKWFVDFGISKTYIKTTATLSTGQKIDTRMDPTAINLSLGYRF